jgi:hypothetical protein
MGAVIVAIDGRVCEVEVSYDSENDVEGPVWPVVVAAVVVPLMLMDDTFEDGADSVLRVCTL